MNVEVYTGLVYLSQALPQFLERISCEEIAPSLGMDAEDLETGLPIQIVSTGLRDILIPIRSRKLLNEVQPNFDAITAFSEKYDVVGYHLFTMDTPDDAAAECRNFCAAVRYSRGERDRNIQRCPAQLFVPTWSTIFAGSGARQVQARVFDGLSF